MEQGRDQGHKEGERALLLRLLRARFGELPAIAVDDSTDPQDFALGDPRNNDRSKLTLWIAEK